MPLIERFHPNYEQAVEEEYVEADDNEGNGSGKGDEGQRNSLQSNFTKDENEEVARSGARGNIENKDDISGSGENADGSGDSGSGDSSNDALDQSSGESGAEDSGESDEKEDSEESGDEEDSGESGNDESGDGDEDRGDEQQGMSQLRNPLSIQGVLYN